MTDIYELLADEICENCAAATDDCIRGCWSREGRCRFACDFDELEDRSKDLTDWVKQVIMSAERYDEYDDELAFLNI